MNPWRERLEYAGFRLGLSLVRTLPPAAAYGLAGWAGRGLFALGDPRARVALTNLRVAFPDRPLDELRRMGRESWAHLAWSAIDAARGPHLSEEALRERFQVTGYEHYEDAVASRRGVLVLVPHLGSFELALMAAPLFGIRVTAIARPLANRRVQSEVHRQRTRHGSELIAHRRVVPRMLEALSEGRNVVVVNDQYTRRSKGLFAPFFGVRSSTSPGPATLALRSGAPVLPFYVVRLSRDRHRAVCLPPLRFQKTGNRRKDIEEATAATNAVLESIIRRHPEQWMWGHRRFRHSPDLPGDPYGSRPRA